MTVAGMLLSYGGSALDDYFEYVTMLLPGNGTNGAQNNTFLDSSTNNFTITRNGNTTQGTFTPYGSNWSNYFTGSSYLTVASNAVLAPGTGDFTIECWVNFQSLPATNAIAAICQNDVDFTSTSSIWWLGLFNNAGTNQLALGQHATSNRGTVNWTPTVGVWYHIVAERQSGTVLMFIDGVQQTVSTSTALNGANFGQEGFMIGAISTPYYLTGYISNLRYTVGAAVYTASFTPSTIPLTTTSQGASASQVELLTCQSNRFIDNSSNAFAITVNSAPSVQRFSPFSPSAAYSTSTNGGSGYFDGSGDSLTAANNTALQLGSTYTTEVWVYPTAYGANLRIWTDGSAGVNNVDLYVTSTGAVAGAGGSFTVTGFTLPLNAWTHIAVIVNAGSLSVYINGTSRTLSGTTTGYNSNSTSTRYFGAYSSAGYDWPGYISDIRFVKGTAVYTSTFTPPTAPLTAISGTSILLNMQNAGIIDNAMISDGETVGGVQVSTAQSKFGGSSMLFNGTTGYLNFQAKPNWVMKGDFTLECWFYLNTVQASMLFDQYTGAGAGLGDWQLYITAAGNVVWYYDNTTSINTGFTVTTGQWYHIACTRASGSMRVFINGTQYGTTPTYTGQFGQNNTMWFGAQHLTGPSYFFAGYADDIRITNGYARYTANFTVPSSAFPTS